MIRIQYLVLLLTFFAACFSVAQNEHQSSAAKSTGVLAQLDGTYSFELRNLDVREIVERLKGLLGIPICFEMEELDPSSQAISVRERLRIMKESGDDPAAIAAFESIAKERPDAVAGWKLPRYDFEFKNTTISGILEEIFRKCQNYTYSFDNTFLVITPKQSALKFSLKSVHIENKSIGEALKENAQLFQQENITVMSPMGGTPGMSDSLNSQIVRLNLESSEAKVYFTRMCQASSPLTTWSLLGMKGGRILTIFPAQTKSP